MGCGITDPVGCVTSVVGGAAGDVANSVFNSIAKSFGEAAGNACNWLWGQLDNATTVDLTSQGIKTDLIATGSIAVIVCMGLFVIQVLVSALRQDIGGLGRAVRGLPIAFLGAAFAIAITGIALAAVDSVSDGAVQFALGTNVQGIGRKLVAIASLQAIGNSAGLLLMSLVVLAAVVVIWAAMMIRKMLIIISAVFAPIAFSGAVSDISKGWVKKWIEFTAALVFSKLILVIIFMIGLSVLDGAGTAGNASATAQITSLACGALTLLLAGFAPWLAIKLVHFAGDSFHAVHAQASAATAGMQQAAALSQKLSNATSKLPGSSGSLGSQGGGSGSPTTPPATTSKPTQPVESATGAPAGSAATPGSGPVAAPASSAAAGGGPTALAVAGGQAAVGAAKSEAARAADLAAPAPRPSDSADPAAGAPGPRRFP